MNLFVDDIYLERTHRLALGFELLDAARGGRLTHPAWVDVEGPLPWTPAWERKRRATSRRPTMPVSPRSNLHRHASGLHTLLYQPGLAEQVDLRIYDRYRRYVPRRLRAPMASLQQVLDAEEQGGAFPFEQRVRRPFLFPGAGHDVNTLATGLRGRVLRNGLVMRWSRVEAFLDTPAAPPLARAQGDDRGEFLLLLPPEASTVSVLVDPIAVRVRVYGPQTVPSPATPQLPTLDRYWDLPLEVWPPPGDPDGVSNGAQLPPGYVEGATRVVPFQLGRILTASDGVDDFDFNLP